MHSYGEIIVDVNTMTTLDQNADLYTDLYVIYMQYHMGI